MIIAIDEVIPYWEQAFAGLGELRPFQGRNLRRADVEDVDALVLRSITRADASLLEGSRVRFVGTASIGMDNLDLAYLQERNICFSNAAGSNANAVSEYVISALLVAAGRRGWDIREKSCAVIGVGHVGSKVATKTQALGMRTLLCDPPLRESTGETKYRFLEDVLDADILTLHVPLTLEGAYPTRHMINAALFDRLAPRKYLINTSRGAVVESAALKAAVITGKLAGAVLDVWENEPRIDYSLLDLVDMGTPHIAGYSLDGKIRATEMIAEALCRCLGLKSTWNASALYPPVTLIQPASGTTGMDTLRTAVLQAYNILRDNSNLRALRSLPVDQAATCFDQLRNNYPLRPEFGHDIVELAPEDLRLAHLFASLGFQTRKSSEPEGEG